MFMHPCVFKVLVNHLVLAMYFCKLLAYSVLSIRQYLSAISMVFIMFLFFTKKGNQNIVTYIQHALLKD